MIAGDEREFLTAREAAQLLRVGHHKLLRWIHEGSLQAVDTGGGSQSQFRIRRRDLDALADSLRHDPGQPQ